MEYHQIKEGMQVLDKLPQFGYGEVVKVNKTTVWVKFYNYRDKLIIYDLDHIQFLERV